MNLRKKVKIFLKKCTFPLWCRNVYEIGSSQQVSYPHLRMVKFAVISIFLMSEALTH